MARDTKLFEGIVQSITAVFQRRATTAAAPEEDSAIETRKEFSGAAAGNNGAFDWYLEEMKDTGKRKDKYNEYERMDTEAVEVSSALDIYADNATSGDRDLNESISIIAESETVTDILNEVKHRLNLDFELWSIARELVKYGDCFEEIVAYDDLEPHRLKHLAPDTMRVVNDEWGRPDPTHPYAQVNEQGEIVVPFADWQVVHFRMTKDRSSNYGVDGSILHGIRKVFKQLAMMEDSLVIARLTRAQQRYAYMIDVEGIEPGEPTLAYLNMVKERMKKHRTIDPLTGKMDLKYNPMSIEEDVFMGKRKDNSSDVKVLQGANNIGQLTDVEYFSKKLFAGLKVPKAWMGFEGDTHARAVITELDVQFAKTVRRVQQALIDGLRQIFDFALVARGFDPAVTEYTLKLPIMSAIDELREWQMEVIKASVAKMYRDLGVNSEWVYRELLELTDDDIAEIMTSLTDPDSIDNVRADAVLTQAQLLAKTTTPAEEEPGMEKPAGTGDEEEEESAKEHLLPRELRLLRYQLGEDLESLYEITDWEFEQRTGRRLQRKPSAAKRERGRG